MAWLRFVSVGACADSWAVQHVAASSGFDVVVKELIARGAKVTRNKWVTPGDRHCSVCVCNMLRACRAGVSCTDVAVSESIKALLDAAAA